MVGYIDKVAEYGTDWTYAHDAKNMYRSLKKQVIGICWSLNPMMFQKAKKISFSGFQEYFIITDIIYLFIAPSVIYLFLISVFCIVV